MSAYQIRVTTSRVVAASAERLFAFLDDPMHIGAHMQRRNWQTAGMRMKYDLDAQQGQAIGSRIVLRGRALWVEFYVEQVVTEREPPRLKAWETVGQVRLVVVGPYRVEFRIEPASLEGSRLAIDIQCEPVARCPLWLTRLYARWCVWRMASDAARHFKHA